MANQRLLDLKLTEINPDKANRQNLGDIPSLARDIEQRGLLYPIVVVPYVVTKGGLLKVGAEATKEPKFQYWLCDGERRYRAYQHMKAETIQALVKLDSITLVEMYEIMFAANAKRLDMNPYDMANALDRYIKEFTREYPDKPRSEAIRKLQGVTGFSSSYLQGRLEILTTSEEVQAKVRDGKIGANVPTEINSSIPKEYRDYAFKRVEEDKVVSTLEFREVGRQLRVIKRSESFDDKTKQNIAKAIIDTGGRINYDDEDEVSNYSLYLGEIEKLRRRIDLWNLVDVNPAEQADLSGRLNDLVERFRNRQKLAQQLTERGALRGARYGRLKQK